MGEKYCVFCGDKMKIIAKERFSYYYCRRCHWYSTSGSDSFDYNGYETFDNKQDEYENYVGYARDILAHKFSIIGRIPKNFLDVGCSEGPYVGAYNMIAGGNSGVGIEVDAQKVKRAIERGLKVYASGDELRNQKYDFVLMRHVVEHIDNPWEFIEYYSDFVASGGCLCIETPNSEDIKDILVNKNRIINDRFLRDLYPPTHVCGYGKDTFEVIWKKLREVGFEKKKICTYDSANTNWMFPSTIKMNLLREVTERLNCAQNIACFLIRE